MKTDQLSPCVVVPELESARAFYVEHFSAKVIFDAGWYLALQIGDAEIAMMTPQESDAEPFTGQGLIYNFRVDDVNREYQRLIGAGLQAVMPLEDHPWGDRGFSLTDPNGIAIYLYTEKEPDADYKRFYKT